MGFIFPEFLSVKLYLLVLVCGVFIGMSKTGVPGVGLAVVPLMAYVFSARSSTGYLLIILIMADVFAVKYYNRHAQWNHVLKLLPWAIAGILLGVYFGKIFSEDTFSKVLSIVVVSGIILMAWQDLIGKNIEIPDYWWFAAILGLVGGFTTMIGNSAGPVMALYLLSMRMPKNKFIGTGAWFFLIVNVFKVPFHIFSWHTINSNTFLFDLTVFPAVLLGVFTGIKIVKKIPEKLFKTLVIITTIIASIGIFFNS